MPAHRIATCCYCGTRAALVLRGDSRHELSCSRCGAPLHDLKMLRRDVDTEVAPKATPARPKPKPVHPNQPHPRPRKVKKPKKRKGLFYKIAEELWDELGDIFD